MSIDPKDSGIYRTIEKGSETISKPNIRIETGIDYPGNDLFSYHAGTTPKASYKVCINKCGKTPGCKLVTFNTAKDVCWGKSKAENLTVTGDRENHWLE